MIKSYKKYLKRGKKLADSHSPRYQLSAEALCKLCMDCECDMWNVALNDYYIGVAVGYRMALNEVRHETYKTV